MYKCINGWSRDQMIDKLIEHVHGLAYQRKVGCLYKAPSGNRCAIGALLPDDFKDFESMGNVYDLLTKHTDLYAYLPLLGAQLNELQAIHDNFAWTDELFEPDHVVSACVNWVVDNVAA